MGKVMRIAIMTIYNALGNYAFPGGKPALDWGSTEIKCKVTTLGIAAGLTMSDIEIDGVSQQSLPNNTEILYGKSLTFKLTCSDNLHIIDDDNFSVLMSNSASGVTISYGTGYNDVTVTIDALTGDVVISADEITYIGYGEQNSPLVAMFDGKNVDWENHQWIDKMDNTRVLKMKSTMSAPASGDHVEFDGVEDSTYAVAESTTIKVNVADTTGTIEAVLKGITCNSTSGNTGRLFFRQTKYTENGVRKPLISANIMYSTLFNNSIGIGCLQTGESNRTYPNVWLTGKSAILPSDFLCFSVSNTRAYLGGQTPALTRSNASGGTIYTGTNDYVTLGVMSWLKESGNFDEVHKGSTVGKAYCIRVYSRALEESEVLHNYLIDQKRFNLS